MGSCIASATIRQPRAPRLKGKHSLRPPGSHLAMVLLAFMAEHVHGARHRTQRVLAKKEIVRTNKIWYPVVPTGGAVLPHGRPRQSDPFGIVSIMRSCR